MSSAAAVPRQHLWPVWVVDASALIRLYVPDGPLHPSAEAAFNQAGSGAGTVMAPQLLLVEVAHVLSRKSKRGELNGAEVQEMLQEILRLPIRYFDHEGLLMASSELAAAHNLSAYDAFYLALAQSKGGRMLTCDDQLQKVANSLGLA